MLSPHFQRWTRLARATALAGAVVSIAVLSLSAAVTAQDATYLRNADDFLTASPPTIAGRPTQSGRVGDSPSAVIPGNYTVIPNVTPSFQGNVSYLRLPNFNTSKSSTATVRIIGNATGRDYGSAIIVSPAKSSPQLSAQELLVRAGGTTFDPTDIKLTLYIQSSELLTGVQHVYYSPISQFFENMSVCSFENGLNYANLTTQVVNVHTSTLFTRFPSIVEIHNRNATTSRLRLRIHDGPTGNLLGSFEFDAAANSSYAFNSVQIENAINYRPTSADFHMNVFLESATSAPLRAVLSHTVTNVDVSAAVLNLTTICSIDF